MKRKLLYTISLIALITLFSGCDKQLSTPVKPKINQNLPVVDSTHIKMIPDITAVALEWKSISIAGAKGYYLIRSDLQQGGKYVRVATIDNKYTTHYLDKGLRANNKYGYKLALLMEDGTESIGSESVTVQTLPPLESVSLIETISDLPKQIKVLWRPHSNPRVEKYIIQRSSPTKAKWKTIETIKDRLKVEYIDDKLGDNETYLYRIKVKTFDKIISRPSAISSATTKALPGQIQGLQATTNLPKKIQLSWAASPTKDVVSYNIYRASSSNGFFTKLSTAPAEHNRFDDLIEEDGKIYFYKITSVDKDGLESEKNNLTPTMGSTLTQPQTPRVTLAQIQGNKMILNWQPTDKRSVSYNVYKKYNTGWTNSKTIIIPNISELRYEDHEVVRGVEYIYSIEAVDEYGLVSKRSEEITSKLPKLVQN
jgi:uncharacterized protein